MASIQNKTATKTLRIPATLPALVISSLIANGGNLREQTIKERFDNFPTNIPGALHVEKYWPQGATNFFVQIANIHIPPSTNGVAATIDEQTELLISESRQNERSCITFLINRGLISSSVMFETVSCETARRIHQKISTGIALTTAELTVANSGFGLLTDDILARKIVPIGALPYSMHVDLISMLSNGKVPDGASSEDDFIYRVREQAIYSNTNLTSILPTSILLGVDHNLDITPVQNGTPRRLAIIKIYITPPGHTPTPRTSDPIPQLKYDISQR